VREASRRAFLSFLPQWFPIPGENTLRNALRLIDDTIFSIIRERRESKEDHKDLLSRLLQARDAETDTGMNDKQLRDECMTAFIAGFETTASSLTWFWYMLDEHPEVESQVRGEIDAVVGKRQPTSADLANLKYTKMVIQEVLRQHPVGWFMPRTANTDDVIGGYPIKAGETVLLSPYLTNYLPEFWEQPEVFDPERFAPDRSNNRHPYAQFTFGGGPRLCIGKHLALLQMQLIVVMMMQRYRLHCVPGHPVEIVPRMALQLRYGLKMTLEPVS
jgi:cytochrome P450